MNHVNQIRIQSWLIDFSIFVFGVLVLSWALIYNGYPLTYGDSAGYAIRAFTREIDHHWALFYSLFIRLTHLNSSMIYVIIFQNILVCFLIWQVIKLLYPSKKRIRLIYFCALILLAILSPLPYISNMLMSDIFTSLGLLAYLILIFGRRNSAAYVLSAIVFIGALIAHNSHLPIFLVFFGITVLFKLMEYKGWKQKTQNIIPLALIGMYILLGSFIVRPLVNAYFNNIPEDMLDVEAENQVSDSKYHFVWVKLKSDSIAYQEFLEEYCPRKQYVYLCSAEKMDSIRDYGFRKVFHWQQNEAFYREMEDAGRTILVDPRYAKVLFKSSFGRFFKLSLNTEFPRNKNVNLALRVYERMYDHLPTEEIRMRHSKIFKQTFFWRAFHHGWLHTSLIYLGYCFGIFLLIKSFSSRQHLKKYTIYNLIFFFVLIHNFLVGTFGNTDNGRYAARVQWLLLFMLILWLADWIKKLVDLNPWKQNITHTYNRLQNYAPQDPVFNKLIYIVWGYFILKTVYFAITIPLGISPDESFHYYQILNHFQSNHFIPDLDAFQGIYGRQYVNNFFYHWLHGKLLRFNIFGMPDLTFLRLIQLPLAFGFLMYSNKLFSLFISKTGSVEKLFFNVLLTNTLMITFLYGMISYDNWINFIAVFSIFHLIRFYQNQQLFDLLIVVPFLVIGNLSKVSFYAFSFLMTVSGLILWVRFIKQMDWRAAFWKNRLLLVIAVLFMLLNGWDLGNKYHKYGDWKVSCTDLYSEEHCLEFDPIYARNVELRKLYDPERIEYPNYLSFIPHWTGSIFTKIYEIRGHVVYHNKSIYIFWIKMILGICLLCFLLTFWKDKHKKEFVIVLGLFLSFAFILSYFSSFKIYTHFGRPIALQGRYIFPVLVIFYLLTAKGFSWISTRLSSKIVLPITLFICAFMVYQEFPTLLQKDGIVTIRDRNQLQLRQNKNRVFSILEDKIQITKDGRDQLKTVLFETPDRFVHTKLSCAILIGNQTYFEKVRIDRNRLLSIRFNKRMRDAMLGQDQIEIAFEAKIPELRLLKTSDEAIYSYFRID